MDPIIRPSNSILMIALQTAEGVPATLDPTLHAIPFEADSFTYGVPFGMEESNEANGSFAAAAPLIIGQEVPLSFRSRIKGAGVGAVYSATVKPPLHPVFACCGWRGLFQAAIAGAALTAGATTSATLGTGFGATPQMYAGMPLILSGGPGAGQVPLITDYTATKVATLSDLLPTLTTATLAAIPANWTYAGTTPVDAASRLTDHPCATVGYYEDGNLYQWQDVRGVLDMEGDTAKPGYAAVSMTGSYLGSSVMSMPTNAVIANHSAPILTKGASGSPSAALMNRKELPISKWGLRNGGTLESITDPNTLNGFAAGQIADRRAMFEADPLATLVTTRDTVAEIQAANNYPIVLRFGQAVGNRWALLVPQAQPVKADPGKRGKQRSHDMGWQGLPSGRDGQNRDRDRSVVFY
jgi:hypothetical protein